MIRALLVDLAALLGPDGAPLADAPGALGALSSLATSEGAVHLGLLADDPGSDPESLARLARRLDTLGLLRFFSPPERAITLVPPSTPPDRHLFEHALARLGLGPALDRALLLAASTARRDAALALAMPCLLVGAGGDITDWKLAASRVADRLAPPSPSPPPSPEQEARDAEQMLRDNNQVAPAGAPLAPGQTHEQPPDGGPPVRKRFSAF